MPDKKNPYFNFSFKRIISKLIIQSVNRINFAKIVHRAAHSKSGEPLFREFSQLPESWSKADDIAKLAAELTFQQIQKENRDINQNEIEGLINEIKIQYARNLHIETATALGLLLEQIFEHARSDLPFVSINGRDIAHVETLKGYRDQGLGVVYLINHSSHMDEFLVDLLFQKLALGLPVFAAGQNMMVIDSIAKLLMTGSYVVLRQGAGRHQMAALYNYCRAVSMCGEQQGIFLEAWRGGARSRDGSLRYPKRLVTLRGAIDVDSELVIQPVSLSFSIVPEDLPLCARKSGISWLRGLGLFKTLLRIPFNPKTFLWKSAKSIYGRAYISMPAPFLLSDLKAAQKKDKSGIQIDEFVALSCIKAIARSKKIMASQITAQGILAAGKKGRTDLVASVSREIDKAKTYHQSTFGTSPDFEDYILRHSVPDIVKDGLSTLKKRKIISRFRKDKKGLPRVKNPAGLSFYATHADRRLYSPTADQNIVVMGAGNWGFALACLIGERILEDKKYINASLTIFDTRVSIAESMGLNRTGPGHFNETLLPKNVFVTSDFSSAFRKASDVVIALKPADFEPNFKKVLTTAEQGLNVMIATRGFLPGHDLPSFLVAKDMVTQSRRKDIRLFILSGPVDPETLVETRKITGILAGPINGRQELEDLFDHSFVQTFISDDPVGVQTADILARIYAIWINFLRASGNVEHRLEIGYLMAQAAEETSALAVHLGGDAKTFMAASIPWTATFTSLCLEGLWHDFGKKLGKAVKKDKPILPVFNKLKAQYEDEGIQIQALADISTVLKCAQKLDLEMPMLKKIEKSFFNG